MNKYTIFIKGWGEYEDAWYPHNTGNNIQMLKEEVFQDWSVQAEFYIRNDNNEKIVEKGFITSSNNTTPQVRALALLAYGLCYSRIPSTAAHV